MFNANGAVLVDLTHNNSVYPDLIVAAELSGKAFWKRTILFGQIHLHPLEAQIVGLVNFVDFDALRHVSKKLRRVKFIVGSRCFDDHGLFLNSKVFVRVRRVNVLDVQIQDLVVRNDSWVGKVVDTGQSLLGHAQRERKHFAQDCHGVGNVHDLLILNDFGNEVAVDEIIGNGHAHSQNQTVGVLLEHGLHVSLGFTVEGSIKVGCVLFGKANSRSLLVRFVVHKNAASGVNSDMNVAHVTEIRQIECSKDIRPHGLRLVVFAPVNVGTSRDSGRIQDMSRLDFIQLFRDSLAIFDPGFGNENLDAIYK
jgi:hypothetical protein